MADRKENQPSKEERSFTRRQFLKGALALGASALIGPGCQQETPSWPEKSPTNQPTGTTTKEPSPTTQSPTATKEPTGIPTPEATPTPEAKLLEGIDIDREYLENAFAGIGGGEELEMMAFGQDYVSQSWGEEIAFSTLAEKPIDSLKYVVSLGAYRGEEGVFSPGKEGETIAFPGLVEDKNGQEKPLTLLRLELDNLPPKDPSRDDYSEWISPQGLALYQNTQITVLGCLDQDKEGKSVIDQDGLESELIHALVAFTDYNRASQDGIPRHYLALVPTHFPADPDNKSALSLANLLSSNGYDYDPSQRAISFIDSETKQKTIWQLNKITGEDLSSDLYRSAGLAFVDQINGEPINNPILPYPEGVQGNYQLERDGDQFIFTGQNEGGEEITLRGSYDQEKEEWGWEKVVSQPEKPDWLPEVSNSRLEINDKGEYLLYNINNDKYIASVRQDNEVGFKFYNLGEYLFPQENPEVFAGASWSEIAQRMEETGFNKCLPVDLGKIREVFVRRFPKTGNNPTGIDFFPSQYPVIFYYPYAGRKEQANPGSSRRVICLDGPNINKPGGLFNFIELYVFANEKPFEISEVKFREITDEENLVGNGIIADLGSPLLKLESGSAELLGRVDYEDNENRMTLDTFVADKNGRPLFPSS